MNKWQEKVGEDCSKRVGIRCVGVSVVEFLPEDSFVCFGAKPDNGLAPEISYETKRRRAVNREELATVREK